MRVKNNVNFSAAERKIKAAIALYGQTAALKLEGEAKRNASWTDRTSNARNSIQGKFTIQANKARIELSGNTDYFIFLELAKAKRYSIINPTILANANDVFKGYQNVVR